MTPNNIIGITEYGAAQKVPGSNILLRIGNKYYLIDIGSHYNNRLDKEPLPFDARTIDCLTESHGHGDHMGLSLKLLKSGFKGRTFATYCTADLTLLQNNQAVKSVFVYNKMVKGKKIPGTNQWIPFKKIEYNDADVKGFMNTFESYDKSHLGFPYNVPIKLSEDAEIMFLEAGHIPGSAQILLTINKDGRKIKILNAVDLGRTDYNITDHPIADIPIVRSPDTKLPKDIDYVVIEATYGDRTHKPLADSLGTLEEAIKDAYKQKGKLIIPAFSIMRTQMLEYFFFKFNELGRLPKDFMVYLSSPSAVDVNKMILEHPEDMDTNARKDFKNKLKNPFNFEKLIIHNKWTETDEIARSASALSSAIIASSGMCDYGRIVSVLENTISDPKNIILLTGYVSPGTRGYLLQNKEKKIPFPDGLVDLKADVRKMGGMSGHADCKEMLAHLKHIKDPAKREQFKGIFIKHGEKEACYALKRELIKAGYDVASIHVMERGKEYAL
ncbi:MBL fold metallo-hydrolase [Candidatus Woesearchaeota archaeon]|nr:MBL fold metallo-hydrolase [Candidatus Woesearchaeota archaeon]